MVYPLKLLCFAFACVQHTSQGEARHDKPIVCVTGISGYVASVLGFELVSEGYSVRGTVRNVEKYASTFNDKNIKLFRADLLEPNSFDEAFSVCNVVMHTASPFFLKVEDSFKDLIQPAVEGTRNVMNAAYRAPFVDTVILTSSAASVGPMQLPENRKPATVPINESDWTTDTTIQNAPYRLSKRLAEQFAWNFVKELPDISVFNNVTGVSQTSKKIKLAVMNPTFILGPLAISRAVCKRCHMRPFHVCCLLLIIKKYFSIQTS